MLANDCDINNIFSRDSAMLSLHLKLSAITLHNCTNFTLIRFGSDLSVIVICCHSCNHELGRGYSDKENISLIQLCHKTGVPVDWEFNGRIFDGLTLCQQFLLSFELIRFNSFNSISISFIFGSFYFLIL